MRKPVFSVFEQVRLKLSCSDLTCEFYYKHNFTADQNRISNACLFYRSGTKKSLYLKIMYISCPNLMPDKFCQYTRYFKNGVIEEISSRYTKTF